MNLQRTQNAATAAVFLQTVSSVIANLKLSLQQDYERAYPELSEIIHLVLDEEESKAWELSVFPHLLLPDLVEAHIENLGLQTTETKHEDVFIPREFNPFAAFQPALALCA